MAASSYFDVLMNEVHEEDLWATVVESMGNVTEFCPVIARSKKNSEKWDVKAFVLSYYLFIFIDTDKIEDVNLRTAMARFFNLYTQHVITPMLDALGQTLGPGLKERFDAIGTRLRKATYQTQRVFDFKKTSDFLSLTEGPISSMDVYLRKHSLPTPTTGATQLLLSRVGPLSADLPSNKDQDTWLNMLIVSNLYWYCATAKNPDQLSTAFVRAGEYIHQLGELAIDADAIASRDERLHKGVEEARLRATQLEQNADEWILFDAYLVYKKWRLKVLGTESYMAALASLEKHFEVSPPEDKNPVPSSPVFPSTQPVPLPTFPRTWAPDPAYEREYGEAMTRFYNRIGTPDEHMEFVERGVFLPQKSDEEVAAIRCAHQERIISDDIRAQRAYEMDVYAPPTPGKARINQRARELDQWLLRADTTMPELLPRQDTFTSVPYSF